MTAGKIELFFNFTKEELIKQKLMEMKKTIYPTTGQRCNKTLCKCKQYCRNRKAGYNI
jgi:hypothetical protein